MFNFKSLLEKILSRVRQWLKPEKVSTDDREWRQDLHSEPVQTNRAVFWTRDVRSAKPPGNNADGGMEWIIARIEGSGYHRLLIMVMGGDRPPSRIYFQTAESDQFSNNVFPVPLMGDHLWRVEAAGDGRLFVYLDNRKIWESDSAGYGISAITFNGYSRRGFRGFWKLV